MVDWSTLTVPEVIGVLGLGATLLAVYKGTVDAKKSTMPVATASSSTPAKDPGIDLDKRYLEAMEKLAEAQIALAAANTRVADVNGRQALAMEGVAKSLSDWIHKYERDKDNDRLESLETKLAHIYNAVFSPEARATFRPHQIEGQKR